MANTVFYKASDRGHANHGWLDAYHYFSFAGYYDPSKIHFGALRVLNDDTVGPGMGFGKHPHDNMEIITIITEGTLQHKDSMGNGEDIKTGEVQVMSAGKGVFHSEFNPDHKNRVKLFQTWIFPEEKDVTPRYDQRAFDASERKGQWQNLVAPMNSDDPGLKIHQQAWIHRVSLEQGKTIPYQLHKHTNGVFILNVSGKFSAEGNLLETRDGVGISGIESLNITADGDSDIILMEVPMQL